MANSDLSTSTIPRPVMCNPGSDGDDCSPAETPTCGPSFCDPDGGLTETRFLWLELTTKCSLMCVHCYNHSSPDGDHGTMGFDDWTRVIDQAAREGVRLIQFIGGEPTMHPDLAPLIRYTVGRGIEVEVYSNLVHVPGFLWDVFSLQGVRLATSWYSDDPDQHRQITGRPTHARTRVNILNALRRSIPLRVGLVGGIIDGQRVEQARAELAELGVTDVRVDWMRGLGRAAPTGEGDMSQLCGRCGHGKAAVLPDGSIAPCPMSRWLAAGDVRSDQLGELLAQAAAKVVKPVAAGCDPAQTDGCSPPCEPQCNPGCDPSVTGDDE